ncbi:hypothetical protein OC835_004759 [Tilletia horrida]|nr:hypothetical protein OC835_004759 [Tilletia horrida]
MPLPRNSLAGLDLDNLILTSRRGTAARNLPKDHVESGPAAAGGPSTSTSAAAQPDASTSSPGSSRRTRTRTTSVSKPAAAPATTAPTASPAASPSKQAQQAAAAAVAPAATRSPSRSSSRRAAAAASLANTNGEPAPSASSFPPAVDQAAPAESSSSASASATGIRKIVLKRKRDDVAPAAAAAVPAQPEAVEAPTPDLPASRSRTRTRAQQAEASTASISAAPVDTAAAAPSTPAPAQVAAQPQAGPSQPAASTSTAASGNPSDTKDEDDDGDDDDDEQDAQGDDDDDDNDNDGADGDGDGDGEGEGDGHSDDDSDDDGNADAGGAGEQSVGPDGTLVKRGERGRRSGPPKLDANGNPIIRKRGERGRRLKPTLRDIEDGLKQLTAEDGTHYIDFFLELPSAEDYPDYYKHIAKPISLHEIDIRLKQRDTTYPNPYTFVSDLRLMFSNAKFYNEDGSPVWLAADKLEKHMDEVLIPAMMKFGFTLDPNDMRKTVLPKRIREPKPPKPPKPPKEKKLTKAERRELERRAQAEEAARLAAEQAAAAASGMPLLTADGMPVPLAANGTGAMDVLASMAAVAGVAAPYMPPPGALPVQMQPVAYPAPALPMHSSPYAPSAHLPQAHGEPYSPHVIAQSVPAVLSPGVPVAQHPHAALPTQQQPQVQQHVQHAHAAQLAHGATGGMPPPVGAGYMAPVGGTMAAAPAPPGAMGLIPSPAGMHAHDGSQHQQYPPVHPHPPMPVLSPPTDPALLAAAAATAAGKLDSGVLMDGAVAGQAVDAAAAAVAANALKAKESPVINPYSPPTVLGIRRPPVIPLVGLDVALEPALDKQPLAKKRKAANDASAVVVVVPEEGGARVPFKKDLRLVLDNWITHQHAITLPKGVDEVRLRFRTTPVTTKLHARRRTALPFPSAALSTRGVVLDEDRKARVPWRWQVRTLINGKLAEAQWRDEDVVLPDAAEGDEQGGADEPESGSAGGKGAAQPAVDAMDVDSAETPAATAEANKTEDTATATAAAAAAAAAESETEGKQRPTRRAAKGKGTAILPPEQPKQQHLQPDPEPEIDISATSAQICTLRFRPARGTTNVVDVIVDSPVVPSARLERLMEREEVLGDEGLRARVQALRTMEEKYRFFIVVP